MIDIEGALAFMATHARLLDRRRFELAVGDGDRAATLAALAAYRNADGGYGWGMEPDLRAPSSQPAGALHAFEVLEEIAPVTSPLAVELCDWLDHVALPSGALPFVLPGADYPGSAPWFAHGDPGAPSLHLTTAVAAVAVRVGGHDPAVREHRWLQRVTSFCLEAIAALDGPRFAMELRHVLELLDTLHGTDGRAPAELERVAAWLPATGTLAVQGGTADEAMRPLDFAPYPGRPIRSHLDPGVVSADLDRLEALQRPDGGWPIEWAEISPAGALEWRGYLTVRAIQLLTANGRVAHHAQAAS
jgi:hypothetical protein